MWEPGKVERGTKSILLGRGPNAMRLKEAKGSVTNHASVVGAERLSTSDGLLQVIGRSIDQRTVFLLSYIRN